MKNVFILQLQSKHIFLFIKTRSVKLTVLGNSAGGSFQGRNYTAQVLEIDNQIFLIDCGEGTQQQIYWQKVKIDKVKQIFISHLHGDHVFGLIGLLTSLAMKKREADLEIFSPTGLQELIETQVRICSIHIPYTLIFKEIDTTLHQKIFENKIVEVYSIPLLHRVPTSGFLFKSKEKPRNIIAEKIEEFEIPYTAIPDIKFGADFTTKTGQVIANAALTIAPNPPKSYAYCSDTQFFPSIIETIRGVNVLYHEATFTDENIPEAAYSMHSTAAQAAEIASQAKVGQLLIGHISARYADFSQHLLEARAIFQETSAAEVGVFEW
jgi:ribonuclease Z